MTTELTDPTIFNRQYDEATGTYRTYHEFVPGCEHLEDFHLKVDPRGGRSVESVPRRWVVHSPDGYSWGYGGSGPADLALNILGLFVPPPEAWRLHQTFKFEKLARLSMNQSHVLKAADVRAWIENVWREESRR